MDNRTAFWIAVVVLAVFAADHWLFEWGLPAQLGILLDRLFEWIAVWR